MKIYKASIDTICGEYGFLDFHLIVAKDLKETEKIANRHIKEENSLYPGETFYKLSMLEELRFVDGYEISNYKLKKLR
jgi:hypothetical protein